MDSVLGQIGRQRESCQRRLEKGEEIVVGGSEILICEIWLCNIWKIVVYDDLEYGKWIYL